jgi:hypothetical protein
MSKHANNRESRSPVIRVSVISSFNVVTRVRRSQDAVEEDWVGVTPWDTSSEQLCSECVQEPRISSTTFWIVGCRTMHYRPSDPGYSTQVRRTQQIARQSLSHIGNDSTLWNSVSVLAAEHENANSCSKTELRMPCSCDASRLRVTVPSRRIADWHFVATTQLDALAQASHLASQYARCCERPVLF